jgi:hypothetical protein
MLKQKNGLLLQWEKLLTKVNCNPLTFNMKTLPFWMVDECASFFTGLTYFPLHSFPLRRRRRPILEVFIMPLSLLFRYVFRCSCRRRLFSEYMKNGGSCRKEGKERHWQLWFKCRRRCYILIYGSIVLQRLTGPRKSYIRFLFISFNATTRYHQNSTI